MSAWRQHDGGNRPRTGDTALYVRLRCRTRDDAETQNPQPARWWKRWGHDGGPGDIVEWRKV